MGDGGLYIAAAFDRCDLVWSLFSHVIDTGRVSTFPSVYNLQMIVKML